MMKKFWSNNSIINEKKYSYKSNFSFVLPLAGTSLCPQSFL